MSRDVYLSLSPERLPIICQGTRPVVLKHACLRTGIVLEVLEWSLESAITPCLIRAYFNVFELERRVVRKW